MIHIGDTVSVRGDQYRVTNIKNCASSGPKFFGKFRFTLVKISDGTMWGAFGKTVTGNSKLTEQ